MRRMRLDKVADQYEAFPYPARDPADEKKRLIQGSPSNIVEIDHFLFGGQRDWSQPFRALVAGGGTGDALIQMAQVLTSAGKQYEITYLDLSSSSRKIAEERAKVRGLTGIRFVTGSLLDAPDLGPFDYIDCCGVLHHLPDPDVGFSALRDALAETGGMGIMVYAPFGRSGVYPLQDGFNAVFGHLAPNDKLVAAKKLFEKIPADHPFRANQRVRDHNNNDAGFYDLLLHSRDRAFSVPELYDALDRAGLELVSFLEPALYDLSRLCDVPSGMGLRQAQTAAEQLRGTMKVHVCYVAPAGSDTQPATGRKMTAVPHLGDTPVAKIADGIARGAQPTLKLGGEKIKLDLPREVAPLIAGVNGRRTLAEIAGASGMDQILFGALWKKVEAEFGNWGKLHYSRLYR